MAVADRIFAAVFPPASDAAIPTPAATPVLNSSGFFGDAFGSQPTPQSSFETGAAEQIQWDRAWHTATSFLVLADEPIRTELDEETLRERWIKPCTMEVRRALEYVVSSESRGRQLRSGRHEEDLVRWYFEEVVLGHYVAFVLPGLIKVMLLIRWG